MSLKRINLWNFLASKHYRLELLNECKRLFYYSYEVLQVVSSECSNYCSHCLHRDMLNLRFASFYCLFRELLFCLHYAIWNFSYIGFFLSQTGHIVCLLFDSDWKYFLKPSSLRYTSKDVTKTKSFKKFFESLWNKNIRVGSSEMKNYVYRNVEDPYENETNNKLLGKETLELSQNRV